jgi:NAD(P)-dependent dehydrogenase (short-subunit alcohol dehydrogenase family)
MAIPVAYGSRKHTDLAADGSPRRLVVMTPITTPFGFSSTAAEVVAGIDLTGKRAIVTGASSGIGIETARALAGAGVQVTLAVRNTGAGARTAEDIAASTGRDHIAVAALDVTDPASVAAFASTWEGPLDILINNAGVMMTPEQRTLQGWELQFATNHLGHFNLARAFRDALAAAGAARIVVVSSSAHLYSPVVFDDLHFRFRPYDALLAYAQSKTAAILFAVGAGARWADDGITANALNPGAIATNLQRHVGGRLVTPPERQKTPQQGAATSVLLATSPDLEGISGRYFDDGNEAPVIDHRAADGTGAAAYALDPANAHRLWDISEALLQRT